MCNAHIGYNVSLLVDSDGCLLFGKVNIFRHPHKFRLQKFDENFIVINTKRENTIDMTHAKKTFNI
jgi:hypothetical protein